MTLSTMIPAGNVIFLTYFTLKKNRKAFSIDQAFHILCDKMRYKILYIIDHNFC